MYLYHQHDHLPLNYLAISCLVLYLLVQSAATGTQVTRAQLPNLTQNPLYLSADELVAPKHDDRLERRTGGRGTQVAISLERVKNPDDYPNPYKKKKFPITWLRNQYPFNTYYKKNKKPEHNKSGKYKGQDPLLGQYSQESAEILDPNPSTWVKIPNRPTASIKFSSQQQALRPQHASYNFLPSPPQVPPASLQYRPSQSELILPSTSANLMMPQSPHYGPRPINFEQQPGIGGLMTSESQQDYSGQKAQPTNAASAPGTAEPQSGFGGISLSFGNGRSISFGGGQGLTIGGRAGAISIGGSKTGSDQQPAASGHSETKGGYHSEAPAAQQAAVPAAGGSYGGQSSYGSGANSYGNGYVNKHPTMSMDFPRKGKTIVHANLDMAPIKFRLHSSPRVKITTGSRDPLEKPSDEELTEGEEDIFEPPEPFAKLNATSTANETLSANNNGTAANGTETTTLTPMQLQQQYGGIKYQQGYNNVNHQQQQFYQVQQQQIYSHNQQMPINVGAPYRPQQQGGYNGPQLPHPHPNPHYQQAPQYHQVHNQPTTHQQIRPPVFDEPPHHAVQSGNYIQQQQIVGATEQHQPAAHYQAPVMRPQHFNESPQQQMEQEQMPIGGQQQIMMTNGDERPAVNQWKQFSREAREQMSKTVPKNHDLTADNNPRFYNGDHNSNSIAEQPQQRLPGSSGERSDSVDVAASDKVGSYASATGNLMNKQNRPPILAIPAPANDIPLQHPQFGRATLYQVAGQPDIQTFQQAPANGGQQHKSMMIPPQRPIQQQQQQQPPVITSQSAISAKQVQKQQQVLDSQESNYHASQPSYQSGGYNRGPSTAESYGSGNHHQPEPVRTYTFGNGGLSTHYGNGGGSSDHSYSGSSSSDGFDQKSYAAKVEKFDPEAHDKRERSKVVLFLKPRISIHMANSSTTTKRPKNPQRFINVVNKPIFLNSTNMTHHDEEFIDPDLKEPMDVSYGYGYGYGNSYGRGYNTKNSTKTTTKKPKTTTTTTTTTTASPDSDSTTTSTGSTSSDSESTTSSTSSDSESSSTTTAAPTTTAESSSSSTTTEAPSSSTTESPSSTSGDEQSSSTVASSSEMSKDSSSGDESSSSSPAPSTTTAASSSESDRSSSSAPDEVSVVDIERVPDAEGGNGSTEPAGSTENPDVETVSTSSASSDDEAGSSADLIAAATESTPTASSKTTAKVPIKSRNPRVSTTSTTSTTTTTTTTTTEPPTTTTSTEAPTTQAQQVELETSTAAVPVSEEPAPSTTAASLILASEAPSSSEQPASTSSSSSASTSTDDSDIVESQSQTKRSTPSAADQQAEATTGSRQQQPMLLNEDLIDKLMSNRTLVNLMSSQLKRVIDTDRMGEDEKRRIVRQVFDQMMEEKVDFSMNNVRLAVKTVSSSYRAAAEKQRKRSSQAAFVETTSPLAQVVEKKQFVGTSGKAIKSHSGGSGKRPVDLKGFGRRASVAASSQTTTASSKSFPVIDTALKLTKGKQQQLAPSASSKSSSASGAVNGPSSGKGRTDSSGNPIVVVLLPQEKA